MIAKVFETRVRIRTLIESGVLEGGEFKEGNRILRLQNKKLYLGPDFGSDVNKARFLPAYQRYLGRCYQCDVVGLTHVTLEVHPLTAGHTWQLI